MIDESKLRSDKFGGCHCYERFYPLILAALPQRCNVLEVGVQHGKSLLDWHKLLPMAYIMGVDICDAPACIANVPNITFVKADAYADDTLTRFKQQLGYRCSLVIDDGSHKFDDQIVFARSYSSLLAPGGVMVIEDMNIANAYLVQKTLPPHLLKRSFVLDLRLYRKRADDVVLIAFND